MRILPVCLYLFKRQKKVCTSENESIYMIHAVSALTHAHVRSQMACGIYYFLVKAILEEEGSLENRLQKGMDRAYQYYRQDLSNHRELENYKRLADLSEFKEKSDIIVANRIDENIRDCKEKIYTRDIFNRD